MHYDPVLCMNVPDTVKTKDAKPTPGKKYLVLGRVMKVIKVVGDNVTVLNPDGFVTHIRIDAFNNAKQLDSKAIDNAIRNCDSNSHFSFKQQPDFEGIDFSKQVVSKVGNSVNQISIKYNPANNSYSGVADINNLATFCLLVESVGFFKEWIVKPK